MTLLPIIFPNELDDIDIITDKSILIFATSTICIIGCLIILFICGKNMHKLEKNHNL